MRKRLMSLIAVATLAASSVFAEEMPDPYLSLGLGGGISLSVPFADSAASNFHPFLEARARVMWFDFTLVGRYTRLADGYDELSAFLGIGICNREARKLRVGLEFGPRFRWVLKDGEGYYLDGDGNPSRVDKAVDYLSYSPVDYRVTVDYLLDNNVAIGGFYQVDTDYRFEAWERIVDLVRPDWDTGRLGFSCMYFFDL